MPSIFFTGATGFLGRSLLDHFENMNTHGSEIKVCALSRDPERFLRQHPQYAEKKWLSFARGNILKPPSVEGSYDYFIHAAAEPQRVDLPILDWISELVDGTRAALYLAKELNISRFLFASSGAVYGAPTSELPFREDSNYAPATYDLNSTYGNAKRWAEHLVFHYGNEFGFDTLIARYFAIISEHIPLNGVYAAGNFINDAMTTNKNAIEIKGNGKAVRTYIDGRTMARFSASILFDGKAGQIYNVGGKNPITILDLARTIQEAIAPKKEIIVQTISNSSGRSLYIPDTTKINTLAGSEEFTLSESINHIISKLASTAQRIDRHDFQ